MHAAYARLGRFSVRFRWAILAVWIAATIAAAHFFPTLASVIKANNTDFLPAGTPSVAASHLASPLQKANLTEIPVVVFRSAAPLSASDTAYYQQRLTAALRSVPHVVAVRDFGRSRDGHAQELQTLSDVAIGQDGPIKALVGNLRSAIRTTGPPAGLQVHLAGEIATQVDAQVHDHTGSSVQELSVLFIIVLLLLIFRAPLAPLITLAPAFLVTQLAGPIVAETTKAGLQVSQLSELMLIVLVLGAGTDYGLFLVFRVREELRAGRSAQDAVTRAVERVGESISFSAGTVIAALLSLLVATFGIYSSLGAPLAIGVFLMLLAALTLLPALVAITGRAMFWPTRTSPGSGKPGAWGLLAGRIVARPALTLGIGLAVFGGLAVAAGGYTASGFGTALTAPAGTDSAAGNAILAARFSKANANPTNVILRFGTSVWTDPQVLADARARLLATGDFTTVEGPTEPNGVAIPPADLTRLHALLGDPRSLPDQPPAGSPIPAVAYRLFRAEGNFISPDGRTVQYLTGLSAGDPSTTTAMHAVPKIRADVARVAAAVHAQAWGVAGEAPGVFDVSTTSNRDLLRVVPLAIAIIGVLLAVVMRSLVAPLYLIASVALSYLAALGVSVLAFQVLGHSGGLTFILPFLMFLFLLALGEDYNILVMTRIREEAATLSLPEAVRRALAATGSTVTSAGLVLAGTFAVFAVAGDRGAGGSQVLDIGAGLALGVLMDTFLVRTLLVPSTVVLLGRWNWWPGRLHRAGEDELPAPRLGDDYPKKTAASA